MKKRLFEESRHHDRGLGLRTIDSQTDTRELLDLSDDSWPRCFPHLKAFDPKLEEIMFRKGELTVPRVCGFYVKTRIEMVRDL